MDRKIVLNEKTNHKILNLTNQNKKQKGFRRNKKVTLYFKPV